MVDRFPRNSHIARHLHEAVTGAGPSHQLILHAGSRKFFRECTRVVREGVELGKTELGARQSRELRS